jgi:hypothetical protein
MISMAWDGFGGSRQILCLWLCQPSHFLIFLENRHTLIQGTPFTDFFFENKKNEGALIIILYFLECQLTLK